jgi:hypothetical protein
MEDYEMVDLMRKRAKRIGPLTGERFLIFPGSPVLCDDRRWRKLGVWKVTTTNSALVGKYNGGLGADELYEIYYGKKVERDEDKNPIF